MAAKQCCGQKNNSELSAQELSRRCHSVLIGVPHEHRLHRRMDQLLSEISACIQDGNPHGLVLRLRTRLRLLLAEYDRTRQ
jgi:hypothetical protein